VEDVTGPFQMPGSLFRIEKPITVDVSEMGGKESLIGGSESKSGSCRQELITTKKKRIIKTQYERIILKLFYQI